LHKLGGSMEFVHKRPQQLSKRGKDAERQVDEWKKTRNFELATPIDAGDAVRETP